MGAPAFGRANPRPTKCMQFEATSSLPKARDGSNPIFSEDGKIMKIPSVPSWAPDSLHLVFVGYELASPAH